MLVGVYSKEILGLHGRMEAVELLDDDGGFGDESFPKPGSSFGSIFGEYWGTVQLGKRSHEIPFISSSRLAVRLCFRNRGFVLTILVISRIWSLISFEKSMRNCGIILSNSSCASSRCMNC